MLVTDEDGLVLADSDPEKNGRPLDDRALLALLRCSELGEKVVVDTGQVDRPARALGRRVPTEDGRARTVMVVGSARTAVDLGVLLRRKESDALRTAWWMVALGGLISILVAVGVVLVAGSSIARRLRVVAWRVAQLGRSDRGTHVRLDGPAELQNVGRELELAAERLAVASELGQEEERRSAEQRGRRAIVDAALTAERTLQAVSVALVGEPDPRSAPALATVRRADGTVAVLFIERMGASLVDAVAAAELRSAGLALLASDGAMGPSALLARLDALAMPGQRARATALSITAKRQVTVASAGARFPALHHGDAVRPVVVRGDRVGELGAERRPEATITLEEGDRLVLSCEQHASGTPLTVVVTV